MANTQNLGKILGKAQAGNAVTFKKNLNNLFSNISDRNSQNKKVQDNQKFKSEDTSSLNYTYKYLLKEGLETLFKAMLEKVNINKEYVNKFKKLEKDLSKIGATEYGGVFFNNLFNCNFSYDKKRLIFKLLNDTEISLRKALFYEAFNEKFVDGEKNFKFPKDSNVKNQIQTGYRENTVALKKHILQQMLGGGIEIDDKDVESFTLFELVQVLQERATELEAEDSYIKSKGLEVSPYPLVLPNCVVGSVTKAQQEGLFESAMQYAGKEGYQETFDASKAGGGKTEMLKLTKFGIYGSIDDENGVVGILEGSDTTKNTLTKLQNLAKKEYLKIAGKKIENSDIEKDTDEINAEYKKIAQNTIVIDLSNAQYLASKNPKDMILNAIKAKLERELGTVESFGYLKKLLTDKRIIINFDELPSMDFSNLQFYYDELLKLKQVCENVSTKTISSTQWNELLANKKAEAAEKINKQTKDEFKENFIGASEDKVKIQDCKNDVKEDIINILENLEAVDGKNAQLICPTIDEDLLVQLMSTKGIRGLASERKFDYLIYTTEDGKYVLVDAKKEISNKPLNLEALEKQTEGKKVIMLYGSRTATGGDFGKLSQNVSKVELYLGNSTLTERDLIQYIARARRPDTCSFNEKTDPVFNIHSNYIANYFGGDREKFLKYLEAQENIIDCRNYLIHHLATEDKILEENLDNRQNNLEDNYKNLKSTNRNEGNPIDNSLITLKNNLEILKNCKNDALNDKNSKLLEGIVKAINDNNINGKNEARKAITPYIFSFSQRECILEQIFDETGNKLPNKNVEEIVREVLQEEISIYKTIAKEETRSSVRLLYAKVIASDAEKHKYDAMVDVCSSLQNVGDIKENNEFKEKQSAIREKCNNLASNQKLLRKEADELIEKNIKKVTPLNNRLQSQRVVPSRLVRHRASLAIPPSSINQNSGNKFVVSPQQEGQNAYLLQKQLRERYAKMSELQAQVDKNNKNQEIPIEELKQNLKKDNKCLKQEAEVERKKLEEEENEILKEKNNSTKVVDVETGTSDLATSQKDMETPESIESIKTSSNILSTPQSKESITLGTSLSEGNTEGKNMINSNILIFSDTKEITKEKNGEFSFNWVDNNFYGSSIVKKTIETDKVNYIISENDYIKTTDNDEVRIEGLEIVGENGELLNLDSNVIEVIANSREFKEIIESSFENGSFKANKDLIMEKLGDCFEIGLFDKSDKKIEDEDIKNNEELKELCEKTVLHAFERACNLKKEMIQNIENQKKKTVEAKPKVTFVDRFNNNNKIDITNPVGSVRLI